MTRLALLLPFSGAQARNSLPALPLFITVIPQALPPWLRGFEVDGQGQPFTQRDELWRGEP